MYTGLALPLCKYAIAVDDKVAVLLLSSEVLDWTSEQKFLTKDSNWFFTSCQNCQAFYFSRVFDAWWSHTEPRILFLSIKIHRFHSYERYIFSAKIQISPLTSSNPNWIFMTHYSKNSILKKPHPFHEFFTNIFLDNFSREIKVVNS